MSPESDKPKIIVDEDWKAQVEAEKAAAKQPEQSTSDAASPAPGSTGGPPPSDFPLPPASLSFLITTLASQAMISLGQAPNPITGKVDVRLPQARHFIDTLAMLEEKTAGHRTPDESTLLTELLHQLRLAYVMLLNAPADQGLI